MKRCILYYAVLLVLLLAGCQKEELAFDTGSSNQATFNVSIVELIPQPQIKTKGTPQSGISAYYTQKIRVLGYEQTPSTPSKDFSTLLSSTDGTNWASDPIPKYDGATYDIYSFGSDLAAITSTENENGVSISNKKITYTVPDDVTKQPDLIIGEKVADKNAGNVSLKMHHALSCIGFVASSHIAGRMVKSIELRNVDGAGTFELGNDPTKGDSWTLSGAATAKFQSIENNSTVELGNSSEALKDIMEGNKYLMMLPQLLPDNAEIEIVVWDGTDPSSESKLIYQIPPTKWEPGRKYVYYFDEPPYAGVAAYYEMYDDRSVGLYYEDTGSIQSHLDTKQIVDAGYGVLVPAGVWMRFPNVPLDIAIGSNSYVSSDPVYIDGSIVAKVNSLGTTVTDCVLYPMSQNHFPYANTLSNYQNKGLMPFNSQIPQVIKAKIQGNPLKEVHGYCLPHFARGIYDTETAVTTNYIRTPIQMRNISYQTGTNFEYPSSGGSTNGNHYIIEPDKLDFTISDERTVFGADVSEARPFYESIVRGVFNGTIDGENTFSGTRKTLFISGLVIKAETSMPYLGLLEMNAIDGTIRNLDLEATCAYVLSAGYSGAWPDPWFGSFGGFVAWNEGTLEGLNNRSSLSYTTTEMVLFMGGIAGLNKTTVENCTNHGTISNLCTNGSSHSGGIVGYNERAMSWESVSEEYKTLMRNRKYWTTLTDAEKAGWPSAKILGCTNKGEILGIGRVGGIAGFNNYAGIVYNCENTQSVTRRQSSSTAISHIGGIVGLQQTGEINSEIVEPAILTQGRRFNPQVIECRNSGTVADQNTTGIQDGNFGGIVGFNDWNNNKNIAIGVTATAYGRVYMCSNTGDVSGYAQEHSGVGGVVGLNSGTVKQCQSTGTIEGKGKTNVGGIVGFNTYYTGDCLYYNSSPTTPISSTNSASYVGGIVGFNAMASAQLDPTQKFADSGYIIRCLCLARAPNTYTSGWAPIVGISPIIGFTTYLYRKADGNPNLNVDGTTGATPLYTVESSFFLSGTNFNTIDKNNPFYEPNIEIKPSTTSGPLVLGPFAKGRYPLGINPLATEYFSVLPLMNVWKVINGVNVWERPSTYPQLTGNPSPSPLPSTIAPSGTAYLAHYLINAIKSGNSNIIVPVGFSLNNTIRIDLVNLAAAGYLGSLTSITINVSNVTLDANAGIVIKAPIGWEITLNGDGNTYGVTTTGRYCYIHSGNIGTVNTITLTKP